MKGGSGNESAAPSRRERSRSRDARGAPPRRQRSHPRNARGAPARRDRSRSRDRRDELQAETCRDSLCQRRKFFVFVNDSERPDLAELMCSRCGTTRGLIYRRLAGL